MGVIRSIRHFKGSKDGSSSHYIRHGAKGTEGLAQSLVVDLGTDVSNEDVVVGYYASRRVQSRSRVSSKVTTTTNSYWM